MCQDFLLPEFPNMFINSAWLMKCGRKLCRKSASMPYSHVLFLNELFNGEIFVFNRSIVLVERLEQKFGNISLS